jgi:hypothetical protein
VKDRGRDLGLSSRLVLGDETKHESVHTSVWGPRPGRSTITVKEELHHLVDGLAGPNADEELSYLRWLASESETPSDENLEVARRGVEEVARGEYITLADLRQSLAACVTRFASSSKRSRSCDSSTAGMRAIGPPGDVYR